MLQGSGSSRTHKRAPRGSLRFLGGQVLGPCAPSTCIRHVGHIPCSLGFGPRGRSTQGARQAGRGPLRGAQGRSHGCILYYTCGTLHRNCGTLFFTCCILHRHRHAPPFASQLQRCASKWRHSASKWRLKGRERAGTALLPEALERGHRVRGAQRATPASGRQALEPRVRWSLG